MSNVTKILLAAAIIFPLTAVEATACAEHAAPSDAAAAAAPTAHGDMFGTYLSIQTALAGDSLEGVQASASTIAGLASAPGASEGMQAVLPDIQRSAAVLAQAGSIQDARAAFGDLSDAMIRYRSLVGGDVPNVAYCGMAEKSWLQDGETIANPYYGSSMLRCGSIVAN